MKNPFDQTESQADQGPIGGFETHPTTEPGMYATHEVVPNGFEATSGMPIGSLEHPNTAKSPEVVYQEETQARRVLGDIAEVHDFRARALQQGGAGHELAA